MSEVTIRRRMPEAAYHAHPALSSTGARRLLLSPAEFDYWRRNPEPPSAEFDLGHAFHAKVLGVGSPAVAYPDEVLAKNGAASTTAAREWADKMRAAGKIPVHAKELAKVDAMAESLLAHPEARAFAEQQGSREVSVFSTDPETGVDVRARFDILGRSRRGRRVAVDLKSTDDPSPKHFAISIARYRYDVQYGHYVKTLDPSGDEVPEFVFIAVGKKPPYLTAVHVLSPRFVETGVADAARARRIYARCLELGEWPGHPGISVAEPPMFHIYDYQDAQENAA